PGPRSRLVRGAGAGRRFRGVRRGGPLDQDSGGHRREQLFTLRVPRADRAEGRALPHARRVPGQRLQRDPQDRAAGRGAPGAGLAPRRARALAAGRGRPFQRLSRRVHGLGAARSLRRAAEVRGRRVPHPRPAGARHRAGAGSGDQVPPVLKLPFFYGWIVVAVAFVTMAVGINARTSFSLLFPAILRAFGLGPGLTAGAFSIGFLISTLFSPLLGRLMDRRGPRVVILLGVLFVGGGMALATLIQRPWQLYATLGLLVSGGSLCLGYTGHALF